MSLFGLVSLIYKYFNGSKAYILLLHVFRMCYFNVVVGYTFYPPSSKYPLISKNIVETYFLFYFTPLSETSDISK